jgi:hypothetical protein
MKAQLIIGCSFINFNHQRDADRFLKISDLGYKIVVCKEQLKLPAGTVVDK